MSRQKNNNLRLKILSGVILFTIIFFSFWPTNFLNFSQIRVKADEGLEELIKSKQKELDELKKQIEGQKDQLKKLQGRIASLKIQISIFNLEISKTELEIKRLTKEIELTQIEIKNLENKIKQKENELVEKQKILDALIYEVYINNTWNFWHLVFTSLTFSDLIEKIKYIETVEEDVKNTIDEINAIKEELNLKKQDLQKKKESLEMLKKEKEDTLADLESRCEAKKKLLEETQGQESEYQKLLAAAQKEEEKINNEISYLLYLSYYGWDGQIVNPDFVCPLKIGCRISTVGGDYLDPNYGFPFPHYGVDLKAKQGTPVYAAGDGVVLVAYKSTTVAISYVVIDHKNGLLSKYYHLSDVTVEVGQVVQKGETMIGLSGGTPGTIGAGYYTTGAHLHFEIRDYNNNPYNPHDFIYILPPS